MNILKTFIKKLFTPDPLEAKLEAATEEAYRQAGERIKTAVTMSEELNNPIRCITQRILKDLEEKDNWVISDQEPGSEIRNLNSQSSYFYRPDLKYYLIWTQGLIFLNVAYSFNDREEKLLKDKLGEITRYNYTKEKRERERLGLIELKKMFPECDLDEKP